MFCGVKCQPSLIEYQVKICVLLSVSLPPNDSQIKGKWYKICLEILYFYHQNDLKRSVLAYISFKELAAKKTHAAFCVRRINTFASESCKHKFPVTLQTWVKSLNSEVIWAA